MPTHSAPQQPATKATYTYDAFGNLILASDANGVVAFTYDGAGSLLSSQVTSAASSVPQVDSTADESQIVGSA